MLKRTLLRRRAVLAAGLASLVAFGAGGAVAFARANDRGKQTPTPSDDERIRAAVDAGEMTKEQAAEKLEWLRAGKAWRGHKPTAEEVERKLQAMVDAGEITREQAAARLQGFRANQTGQAIGSGRGSAD